MTWSYSIGRVLGSDIRVHVTFVFLLLWIGISAWQAEGGTAAAYAVLFILALFACVVAHELGHALMARRFGIRTPDITLLPIGGVARLERIPENPVEEIWVAAAGPAVSLALWIVLSLVAGRMPYLDGLQNFDFSPSGFLAELASVNLLLVLFNLIPAFPMDGGRVLRAVLALRYDRARATSIAGGIGQAVAVAFGVYGVVSGNLILLLVAFFVFAAATAETADVEMKALSADVPVREAMITSFEAIRPEDSLMAMSAALLHTTQHEFPVISTAGQFVGFVTRDAIFKAAAGEGNVRAEDVMVREVPRVGLKAPLRLALDALAGQGVPAVAVCGAGGDFLGYVTRENVGEWMILNRSRRR